ncbi:(+)-neomenthol dehydrogenase-like [Quillaja saponaria]|uniref:(+)-neomenthol dehydrogenase-like n=1 Tax=Quillaja saponaria TaxID=32244 RepID=A0AAD7LLJ2_QUISA|nr:(+)-neomenthol dehydrogenase-like [Quillaja saponaria]
MKFLHDLKDNALDSNGWTMMVPVYSISKASLNAYTRLLAKKYPEMLINCVHPSYVSTDMRGILTVEEGAKGPVMLALLQDGGPTGMQVVTGANKGIGLETVRQLASHGITVVLTARDETRGTEATRKLHQLGLSNVIFHQLDVLDPVSIQSLAKFIQDKFGRLDILVNNAGASGVVADEKALKALNIDTAAWISGKGNHLVQGIVTHTYEQGEKCINTNYYGVKRVTEALLPLLQLSPAGTRIVNVSSCSGALTRIPMNIRNELGDIKVLNEGRIDEILLKFLHDFKDNALESCGWTMMAPAYSISKASLNAYTRILAKKCPEMVINCVHPGYVSTDMTWHGGILTVEEGAKGPVMLALLQDGGPTGCYFDRTQQAEF